MIHSTLLSPLTIKSVTFRNRIVMPPLVIWESDAGAEVKDTHLRHYETSAGPGLMILEATTVSPEGKLHAKQLGIFEDRHIAGLARLAAIIKKGGAVAGIQLHHAGARASRVTNWGARPLAPSTDGILPPADTGCGQLSKDEIRRIQADFVAAAERAIEAGFQILELHGAHGYLGSQFLSPLTNTRTDEYGGNLENRQRFLNETYRACRDAVGSRALLSCRLGVIDQDERGLTLEEGIDTARRLEAEGAPLLHISCAHKTPDSVRPEGSDFNPLFHLAAAVKPRLSIPVIGVGGIIHPDQAENALNQEMADMVAVGRGMLADPEWAAKTVAGRSSRINRCVRCPRCHWYTEPENCPTRKKAKNTLGQL
jgi:2,4-dienoyl-CoA reductase-like NADH-dependent reductase (Old Yellow Enzyme family)